MPQRIIRPGINLVDGYSETIVSLQDQGLVKTVSRE